MNQSNRERRLLSRGGHVGITLLDEVVEGVNRELDLLKSFPVYQAVPRSEATAKSGPYDGATG